MSYRRFNSIEEGIDQKDTLEAAYKKALSISNFIDIKDFSDLYGNDQVEADLNQISKLEEKFGEADQAKQLASILEAIIFEHGEQSYWFGENASTIKTSRFDDIINGVDAIVEFDEKTHPAHLALAIDATFSEIVTDKFKNLKTKIDQGKLAVVKYFQSERISFRGEMSNIPFIVVTANVKTVKELSNLWINKDNEALAKHWIQFQLLEEMEKQCVVLSQYANSIGQDRLAEKYKTISKLVQQIVIERRKKVTDTGERDQNLYSVQSDLELIFGVNN